MMKRHFFEAVFNKQGSRNMRLVLFLLFTMVVTAIVMFLFELTKMLVIPDITLWQSHILTIIFACVATPWVALLAFLKFEELYEKLIRENEGRKRSEELLKESQSNLELILESTDQGIVQIDSNGVCRLMNKSACSMLGYGPSESIGRELHSLTRHSLADGTPCPAEQCGIMVVLRTGEGKRVSGELFHRKDGTPFPVEYSAYPTYHGNVLIGAVVTFSDITERKHIEEELKEAKTQAELYMDLMGHDIRNMNQVSMGFLELALESPSIDKKEKELLLKSMGGLENSTRLIDNVRKMQKVQTREYKLYPVDACQAILRVLGHYSNMPGVKATLNYELPPVCMVMANDLLYEVFENLVGNAIKHAGPEPTINIKYETTKLNGKDYNQFVVEDDGPGIPDDLKKNIFNRRLRSDTKTMGGGLGLYIVKSLTDSYSGKVWVEDRVPGDYKKGARFVVMLPTIKIE